MNLFRKAHEAVNTFSVKDTNEVKRIIEEQTASKEIEEQLRNMTNAEWETLLNNLQQFVEMKLRGRTKYGAHSVYFLGEEACEYYIMISISKVLTMERKWDFKIFTLEDQLKRIIGSLMSKNVERFKNQKVQFLHEDEDTLEFLSFTYAPEEEDPEFDNDRDVQYHILYQAHKIIFDDLEMKIYTLVYYNYMGSAEIAEFLGMEKKVIQAIRHNAKRRLVRFLKKRFEEYKKNTTDNYDFETSI